MWRVGGREGIFFFGGREGVRWLIFCDARRERRIAVQCMAGDVENDRLCVASGCGVSGSAYQQSRDVVEYFE